MTALFQAILCGLVGAGLLKLGMWLHPGGHVGQNMGFWDGLFATSGFFIILGSVVAVGIIISNMLFGDRG